MDPIPQELQSDFFRVSIQRQTSRVLHAVSGYYLLSFDLTGRATVSITAKDPHFWDQGVEVQPMRLGIRPHRAGAKITFTVPGPGKYVVTRPGDHFADAKMLFLFANAPERQVSSAAPGVRYYGTGIHHENIDAHDGDQIYLAPGAVIFGSLNIWQVHDVHVFGRGTIIYDGPQNPNDDEGWMQPQVCGSTGDAVQPLRLSLVLRRGLHRFSIIKGPEPENAAPLLPGGGPVLLWEGPDLRIEAIPGAAIRH